jgi:hypothetical protein
MTGDARARAQISAIAGQLKLDTSLLFSEILWALGEERINRVMPAPDQFREWRRQPEGLLEFWRFADRKLGASLQQDEIIDIWKCVDLTLTAKVRRTFAFDDYLMIAVRSEHKCQICCRCPPGVRLEIDHILPVSRGGSESVLNLRFLCEHHNRARGNRFHWAEVWRRES